MKYNTPIAADAPPPVLVQTFESKLKDYLQRGYKVLSDGPSGIQLEGPKVMRTQTKVAMLIGAVLVLAYGIGLIVILFALIDHAMAKPPAVFLSR